MFCGKKLSLTALELINDMAQHVTPHGMAHLTSGMFLIQERNTTWLYFYSWQARPISHTVMSL